MRLRTVLLFALTAACGIGIAALAPLANGMYAAICVFMLPFLAAFLIVSIGYDVAKPRLTVYEPDDLRAALLQPIDAKVQTAVEQTKAA